MSTLPSSGRSAGSRRFWLTVLFFALANIAAWIGYHLWTTSGQPRRDILIMQRFAQHLDAHNQPPLTWTFNLDVAHPGPLAQPPGEIKPRLSGVWLWTSSRTLAFQPAEPLPPATRFTATLSPAMLITSEGFTLPAPVTSSFSTTPLSLQSVKQAGFDDRGQMLLELAFNDKVIPAEVLTHVRVADENNVTVKVTLNGQAAGNIVRLLTDPLVFIDPTKDKTLTLTLTKGLAGASGPLGIEKDSAWDVPVSSRLTVDHLEATVPSDGDPEISILFNNTITDDTVDLLKPLISIEPKVDFTPRKDYRNSIILSGPFTPATRYTVTIAKAPGDGTHGLLHAATLSVFVPDRDPAAYFENTSGYLGSAGNRTVLIKAVNVPALRVSAEKVYENNLVQWRTTRGRWSAPSPDRFSHPVATRRYILPVKKNVLQDVRVNLDDLIGKGAASDGAYRLSIQTDNSTLADSGAGDAMESYDASDNSTAVITLSDIGLTAKLMPDPTTTSTEQSLLAWAVSLSTGKSLPGIRLRLYSDKNQLLGEAATDKDGLARIEHVNTAQGETPAILIAENSEHALTWLDLARSLRNDRIADAGGRAYLRSGYEAFVYTERGVYRPGETVTLRAIVRGKDLTVPPPGMPLRFQLRRPDGRDFTTQNVQLDADGACEWKTPFAGDAPTGYWSAELGLPGDSGGGSNAMQVFGSADFQIEEFIPDRIKTALALSGKSITAAHDAAPARLALADDPLLIDVQSDYLFGQPCANLEATVTATVTPEQFASPSFPATDGWLCGDTANAYQVLGDKHPTFDQTNLPPMTLDRNGHTQFVMDLAKKLAPDGDSLYTFRGPWQVSISTTTLETGGRPVTAYATAIADALPYYVMARPVDAAGFIPLGSPATFEVRLAPPPGNAPPETPAPLTMTVFAENWSSTLIRNQGHYQYQSTRTLTPVKDALDLPVPSDGRITWKPSETGTFVIQFADAQTHQITTLPLEVGEPGGWNASVNQQNPETLEIKLVSAGNPAPKDGAAPIFKSGQPVKALVRSPFAGVLLLTIETDTVLVSQVITMDTASAEISLDLPPGARPNGYVSATVVRAVEPNKPWRTHRAFGLARFTIDPAPDKLNVAISAPTETRPLSPADITLTLTNPDGTPAKNAAIAFAAVDEGILRLTAFDTPDPLSFFHSPRALGIQTSDIYDDLMPEVAKLDGESPTGGDADGESKGFSRRHSSPVSAKRVRPVALVSEIVHTDDAGQAAIHLQLPEFLGQLRLMAVAYSGPLMGSADRTLLVRSPLVIQSSFPRFLAPGDRCDISLLLINNTKSPGTAHLTLTTDPALAFDRTAADISLAPNEQKTISLSLAAMPTAGVGHITLEGILNGEQYSEHVELPIRPASPAITRGETLRADTEKDLAINPPDDLLPGTSSTQIRITPRPLLQIPQGLDYLNRYPYGCLEQTTSGALPLVYLHDLGDQLAPNLFDQQALSAKIATAIQRLMAMQTADGGLSMWPGETENWPWGTVYAAHFLIEAEHAGYPVPADFKAHTLAYLRSMLAKSTEVGPDTDIDAYALYVLALDGHPDRPAMNRIGEILDAYANVAAPPDGLSDARFHLALAWVAAGRMDLAQRLIPDSLPPLTARRTLNGDISSPITDQSLELTTLLAIDPNHPAAPALAERLSAAGMSHEWESTQDNALAVMALGKYFRTLKDEKPFDQATLTSDGKTLAASANGKPLMWNSPSAPAHLLVHLAGPHGATGFVSWIQSGVPLTPADDTDHALKIRRVYLNENGEPLATDIPAGAAIRVQITLDSPTALDNVVIDDLLPAGLEIENPRLATTLKDNHPLSSFSPVRLEVRDDRLVAVGQVPAGVTTYTYLARAVTAGDYTLPPVHAECMYDPAINSIHGAGHIHIIPDRKALALK